MKSIGERIKKLRKEAKLSQQAVADMIGVTDVTIGYWEKETAEPSLSNGYKLSKILNTSVGFLIDGVDDSQTPLDRSLLERAVLEVEKAAIATNKIVSTEAKVSLYVSRYMLGDNATFSEIIELFDIPGLEQQEKP